MEGPLVSIYIPTRNRARLLTRALDSIARQTYRPLEVIVVDDGSTDDTPALLAAFQAQGCLNLVCIRNDTSMGASAARNKAIQIARGEFITGLDDDDEFTPDRVERFLRDWQAREVGGEAFSALYAQDIVRKGSRQFISRKPAQVAWQDLCGANLINNQLFTRRSTLLAIGGFDAALPMWQDLECWLRLTQAFGPARRTDAATYVFYLDAATDRISFNGASRLREAYEHVARKHAAMMRPSLQRALFLQMYGYPIKVGREDILTFLRLFGISPTGLAVLAKAALRYRLAPLLTRLRSGG